MAKLALALLCAAFALVAARQLHQTSPMATIAQLPEQLQALNSRMAAYVSQNAPTKSSTMSLLDKYGDYYQKYSKYADKHEHRHHEGKYEHEREYEHEPKYEHDEYEQHYDAPKYYYNSNKVAVKLYEKFRSKLRPQEGNPDTFQFTSELTCQNPSAKEHEHNEDGVINFPIVSNRMKLVTVGVCEWTVNLVKEQHISEHATLKGNTNVVCRFTEEAERNCGYAEDVLCDGMAVSGQGLLYNFEAEGLTYDKYDKAEDAKLADDKAAAKAEDEDKQDVYLTIINGVLGAKKHMKWDNGALQYFFGKPATAADKGRDGSVPNKHGDPTGEYTFMFKSN